MRVRLLAAVGLLVCLGAAGAGAAPPNASQTTAKPLKKGQLPLLVVPKEALGAPARPLEVAWESGFYDAEGLADQTFDPKDRATNILRGGWSHGYRLSYTDVTYRALIQKRGYAEISSGVDLFRTAREADAFFSKQVQDLQKFRGKTVEGIRLERVRLFKVKQLGDRTVGVTVVLRQGGLRLRSTGVFFLRGTAIGTVGVVRLDATPTTKLADKMAQALAKRFDQAAAGTLRGKPVPLPVKGQKGKRPPGGPNLARMALGLADMPDGASIDSEGYLQSDNSLGEYERIFNTQNAVFGTSSVGFVFSTVKLYRTTAEAKGAVRASKFAYRTVFSELLGGAAGIKLEQQPSFRVGDDSSVIVISASIEGTVVFRSALVEFHVGRVHGMLVAFGDAESFKFADIQHLATAMAKRMRSR